MSMRRHAPQLVLLITLLFSAVGEPALAQQDPVAGDRQDEIEARFAEAYAALNAERLYTARKLLAELVTDYPTLLRARLELARAEYLARDLDAAEAQVLRVLDDPEVPASVRTTLLAFLAQIRDDQQTLADRHSWSGQIYGGLLYDSNVNFGVSRDVIDLGGARLNLAPELSDGAGVIDAGLGHTYNPNKTFRSGERTGFFLWQSQLNGYYRGYFGNDEFTLPVPPATTISTEDFDLGVATFRTGPSWVVPGAWRFGIGLQADQLWLGGSKLAFIGSVNPNGTWQLNPLTAVSAGLTWSRRNFQQFSPDGRDGDLWRADASISRLVLERKVNLEAGIGYGVLDADDERFSFGSADAFVGATWQAWTRGQLYTRLGYRKFNYDGAELPPFSAARNEDEWRYTLGFRHQFARTFLEGWVLRGEWIYTNNSSNIPVFEFDRNLLSIGLEKSF
ncbi:MAG: DUF2860 family protein [Gammaproteobacteria bacterium]|nr:DUF2860 family protein [Gammaproteobacteria bacterium]